MLGTVYVSVSGHEIVRKHWHKNPPARRAETRQIPLACSRSLTSTYLNSLNLLPILAKLTSSIALIDSSCLESLISPSPSDDVVAGDEKAAATREDT